MIELKVIKIAYRVICKSKVSFKELGNFLKKNKDNNKELFSHERKEILSHGLIKQEDVTKEVVLI